MFTRTYDIHFVENKKYCSLWCRALHPEVVYAEFRVPDIPSIRRLHDTFTYYHPLTPLIIATGNNNPDLEQFIRIRGMFYYLVRPFTLAELWDALEAAILEFHHLKHPEFLKYRSPDSMTTHSINQNNAMINNLKPLPSHGKE